MVVPLAPSPSEKPYRPCNFTSPSRRRITLMNRVIDPMNHAAGRVVRLTRLSAEQLSSSESQALTIGSSCQNSPRESAWKGWHWRLVRQCREREDVQTMSGHRKRIQHFHDPGDCHELTFSTFHQKQLLTNDLWRKMLCTAIDRGIAGHKFRLIAFVLMPEHVHLLVYPTVLKENGDAPVDDLLYAIKRPFSFRIKQLLIQERSPLLAELTILERPGKTAFRFWQEGPGYDRNFSSEQAVIDAIDYIHNNPVSRGLAKKARDWKWSSARWYESDKQIVDPDLPTIHGLPWESFA
jgi:putative transposase